jgi:hypothetical protein
MSDIERLQDEIERLRGYRDAAEADAALAHLALRKIADQSATMSVCNGNVTVEIDCDCQVSSQKNFSITALEEEAIRVAIESLYRRGAWDACEKLRGLLKRLG